MMSSCFCPETKLTEQCLIQLALSSTLQLRIPSLVFSNFMLQINLKKKKKKKKKKKNISSFLFSFAAAAVDMVQIIVEILLFGDTTCKNI